MFGNESGPSSLRTSARPHLSSAPHDNLDNHHHGALSQISDSLESIEAEALELLGQRKRRKRVRYSCTECHRRKHRCDRETPCGKCVERGVASACIPHDGSAQDVHDRMRQLEGVLSRLVEASRNSSHRTSAHNTPLATSAMAATARSGSSSGISPNNRTASSSHSTPDGRHGGSCTPRRKSNPGVTTAASLPFRAQVGSEMLEFSSSTQSYPPSAHFERLVREGSLQPDEIRNLASALPSQDETATLLDIFFRDINPLMFPFDEMWFRQAVNSAVDVIWGDADVTYGQDGPDHLSVISLLFSILSLTYLSLPLNLGTEAEGAAQAARMSFQCRRSHMLASSIQSHDPFIVLSHIILARFLILQRQAKDSWLVLGEAIRQAQVLGLHRLGAGPTSNNYYVETRDAQMRRTIWMHLYYEDRFSSLIVGQAPLIHDSFCDTQPPSDGLWNDTDPNVFHLATIVRIRHKLSGIVSKALDLFFSDEHDMAYDQVLRLDHELDQFQKDLPDPYRMDDDDTGWTLRRPRMGRDDGSYRKVALHRFVLHVSVCYVLISIHLPYLRRGSADSGFERSRQAAMQAAIGDHKARYELRQRLEWPNHLARDSFVGGRFFYFHATSALGICLLSEPSVPRVRQLVPLLDEFLEFAKDHQRQQGVDPNRCIRQEIGIVSLIRGRVKRNLALNESGATSFQTSRPSTAASRGNLLTSQPNRTESSDSIISSTRTAAQASQPQTWANGSWQTTPLSEVEELFAESLPAENRVSEVMDTRQPEVGEDMYDWWSWLVSSLSPSDLAAGLTPADTAAANTRTHTE